jgi:hypothetical protein
MGESRGTLDALIVPVANAFEQVGEILAEDATGGDLLADLGYKVPGAADLGQLFTDVAGAAGKLTTALGDVVAAYEDGSYEDASFLPKVIKLADAVADVATTANDLKQRAETAYNALPDFLANGHLDEMPQRLVDFLLVSYLKKEHPRIAATLSLLGVIAETFVPESDYNPDFVHVEILWANLPTWFSDPRSAVVAEYSWGTAEFTDRKLLERFKLLLWQFGLPAIDTHVPDSANPDEAGKFQLDIPLFAGAVETTADGLAGVEVGLALHRAEDANDADNAGLAIEPYVDGALSVPIPLRDGWTITLSAAIDAQGLALEFHPATGTEVSADAAVSGSVALTFGRSSADLGPLVLFGNSDGTRLQIGDFSIGVMASESTGAAGFDAGFELKLDGLALIVQASEGDGFLKLVLPSDPLEMKLDLLLGMTRQRGFYFSGGAGFEYTFHLNEDIGPLFVDTVDLAVKLDPAALDIQITATGGLELGPFLAVVKDIGLTTKLELGKPGNLGGSNLALGFKPPSGIGMSLDAGVVKAAGFLLIDTEHGRYAGAIALSVAEKFDLAAVGLIDTKMPDGSEGFAFLLIIGITFPVPIPLSYNFYFAGAGGLLGLNRSMDIDALRIGLRSGAADSVLLPSDPQDIVRRFDAIVRDLEAIFPPAEGQFLIGPIALITWSNPPLISVKVAIIIEIPKPIRVVIVGILQLALPDPDDAVLKLKVAFMGAIDVEASLLSFDASIYDSYIGTEGYKLTIEGDIALRLCWGPQPEFLTSVGGFHPQYHPPAYLQLPPMRRISVSLAKDNPRLSLGAYFALTSNTLQFGARLDLLFNVSSFSVVGQFSLDVLLQFSPFSLQADVSARLSVRSGSDELMSISLDFTLTGPTPWVARGKASFKVLMFSVSVDFDSRFGEEALNSMPDVAVLGAVTDELKKDSNWRGELAAGASQAIQMLPADPGDGNVLIDPGGSVTVSQSVLPLSTDFTLFGNSKPNDAQNVRVKELRLGGKAPKATADVTEPFAPAAFQAMSDRDKLAAPSYEPRPSGIQATSDNDLITDYALPKPVAYEVISSDLAAGGQPTNQGKQDEPRGNFEALVPGGAVGQSTQSKANAKRAEKGTQLDAGVARDLFAVASVRDLRPLGANGQPAARTGTDSSGHPLYADGVLLLRTDADARLQALQASAAADAQLQVVPEAQLAA